MYRNLRDFLADLRKKNLVQDIECEVDPHLEVAEIHRRVIEEQGKVLFFKKVKGSPFSLVTNLFGTLERVEMAFGNKPLEFVKNLVHLAETALPPKMKNLWESRDLLMKLSRIGTKTKSFGPVFQNRLDLSHGKGLNLLPAIQQWEEDGGKFVTLPLVYTEHPTSKKSNLGMYRIQLYDEKTTGMHWQIQKGGGFHYAEAERANQSLPVTLMVGGPPALILSAIAPLPEDISELLLCSLVMGEKVPLAKMDGLPHAVVAESEFACIGTVAPHERRLEGPFGDHYGYYSLAHDYPVFKLTHMFHRENPIYPATVVGRPRQEDFYLGDYLQNLLSPLFPLVMHGLKALKTFGETGFHALALGYTTERYEREAMRLAFRILGEGQLSLQKVLMLSNVDFTQKDFKETLTFFLANTNWETDLFIISQLSQDTLDYTGPKVNHGSKMIWLGFNQKQPKALCERMPETLERAGFKSKIFVPGCLVVQGPNYSSRADFAQEVLRAEGIEAFELVLLVDDINEASANSELFLWTWFTRFEPAADVYAAESKLDRFHVTLKSPIVIDCRMKPWYPKVLECDEKTKKLVDSRWKEYNLKTSVQ